MSELFKSSIEKIREKFVRSRFGEEKIFYTPKIEEWLESQRRAEKPDVNLWYRLLSTGTLYHAMDKGEAARVLEAGGYRYCDHPKGLSEGHTHEKRLEPLLKTLNKPEQYRGSVVYLNIKGHPIVVIYDIGESDVYNLVSSYINLMPDDVHGSLLLCWEECMRGNREQVLRAESARAEMVHFVDVGIRKVRQSAEADFDKAVAVSEDGTKIVCADIVYVWSDGEKPPIHIDAGLCREKKLLLEPDGHLRQQLNERECLKENLQEILIRGIKTLIDRNWRKQMFFQIGGKVVFLTHKSLVPDSTVTHYRL